MKGGDANDIARNGGPSAVRLALLDTPDERPVVHAENRQLDTLPRIQSSAEFVDGFKPPDYVISGIIQRGFLYSNTGPTGSGKTAIALRLLATVALGRAIGGCDVEHGRCLMLVGENPDDVRMRWIALGEQMGFALGEIDVHFILGVFPIPELLATVGERMKALGGLSLVIVDTGAAFFPGENENDNKEQGDYARSLRTLTDLPGRPSVLVNCHPVKNATQDNLIPRGGGAFIAEVDGNLCCKKTDAMVELYWQGKFRGPDFAPISFELPTIASAQIVDSKGRKIPTVFARPLSTFETASLENAAEVDLQRLLRTMGETPGASIAALAEAMGWVTADGNPQKSRIHRRLLDLKNQRLATQELKKWVLTPAGKRAAKRVEK